MSVVFSLAMSSFMLVLFMGVLDVIFDISSMKNYWCREFFPTAGVLLVFTTLFLFFICILLLIWT